MSRILGQLICKLIKSPPCLPSHYTNNLESFLSPYIILVLSFVYQFFIILPIPLLLFSDTLYSALPSLNIPIFSHFVLVGDFNLNMNDSSHHLHHKVCTLLDYFNFTQVVSDFTHVAPCGSTSLIDLVFTSSPSQILGCDTIPPLDNPNAKSYHHGLHITISWKPPDSQRNHLHR